MSRFNQSALKWALVFVFACAGTAGGADRKALSTIQVAQLMNKEILNADDLKMLDSAFKFSEDRFVFEALKKQKTFFPIRQWRAEAHLETVFLTFAGQSEIKFSLDRATNVAIINDKKFKISFKKPLWNQVRSLLTPSKTSSLFSLFLPPAYAEEPMASPEAEFLVSMLALRNQFDGDSGFSKTDETQKLKVDLVELNKAEIKAGADLQCRPKQTTGKLNIQIGSKTVAAEFHSDFIDDKLMGPTSITTKLTIEGDKNVDAERHLVAKVGKQSDARESACRFKDATYAEGKVLIDGQPANAPKPPSTDESTLAAEIRSKKKFTFNRDLEFAKHIRNALNGKNVLNPIIVRCQVENKGSPLTADVLFPCLRKICSGEIYTSLETIDTTSVDLSAIDPLVLAARTELQSDFDKMNKLAKAKGADLSNCQEPSEYCRIKIEEKPENQDLIEAYDDFQGQLIIVEKAESQIKAAIESAYMVAESATACCAISSCREKYNSTGKFSPVYEDSKPAQ